VQIISRGFTAWNNSFQEVVVFFLHEWYQVGDGAAVKKRKARQAAGNIKEDPATAAIVPEV
jgi:hypothetical protein